MTSLPVPTRRRKITQMTISLALTDRQDSATIQAGRRNIVISVQATEHANLPAAALLFQDYTFESNHKRIR